MSCLLCSAVSHFSSCVSSLMRLPCLRLYSLSHLFTSLFICVLRVFLHFVFFELLDPLVCFRRQSGMEALGVDSLAIEPRSWDMELHLSGGKGPWTRRWEILYSQDHLNRQVGLERVCWRGSGVVLRERQQVGLGICHSLASCLYVGGFSRGLQDCFPVPPVQGTDFDFSLPKSSLIKHWSPADPFVSVKCD